MICQGCGKEVEPTELHTYEDCQNYILAKKLAGLHSLQTEWNQILKEAE
jgi:hypothetical protein